MNFIRREWGVGAPSTGGLSVWGRGLCCQKHSHDQESIDKKKYFLFKTLIKKEKMVLKGIDYDVFCVSDKKCLDLFGNQV